MFFCIHHVLYVESGLEPLGAEGVASGGGYIEEELWLVERQSVPAIVSDVGQVAASSGNRTAQGESGNGQNQH